VTPPDLKPSLQIGLTSSPSDLSTLAFAELLTLREGASSELTRRLAALTDILTQRVKSRLFLEEIAFIRSGVLLTYLSRPMLTTQSYRVCVTVPPEAFDTSLETILNTMQITTEEYTEQWN
jgi:hypothetical protein